MELTLAQVFGILAFSGHLVGYLWYAQCIFSERVRPNVAACFMWLVGNWIEFAIYDAMPGTHWAISALPFACGLGMGLIFLAIVYAQLRARGSGRVTYHPPDRYDYYLILFDLAAIVLWLVGGVPHWATVVAVSTSIVTYIPLWRTTHQHPEKEHVGPWLFWCLAYLCMFVTILLEGGEGIGWRLFYPLYYGILSIVVVIILIPYMLRSSKK